MFAYRINLPEKIEDLSGKDCAEKGGRWNEKGIPMIYLSSSVSLATVESIVHMSAGDHEKEFKILTLEIPDDIEKFVIYLNELPERWNIHPPEAHTIKKGSDWARSNRSLILQVPSAVITCEHNILLNPLHPEMQRVRIKSIEPFGFDKRLFTN